MKAEITAPYGKTKKEVKGGTFWRLQLVLCRDFVILAPDQTLPTGPLFSCLNVQTFIVTVSSWTARQRKSFPYFST